MRNLVLTVMVNVHRINKAGLQSPRFVLFGGFRQDSVIIYPLARSSMAEVVQPSPVDNGRDESSWNQEKDQVLVVLVLNGQGENTSIRIEFCRSSVAWLGIPNHQVPTSSTLDEKRTSHMPPTSSTREAAMRPTPRRSRLRRLRGFGRGGYRAETNGEEEAAVSTGCRQIYSVS